MAGTCDVDVQDWAMPKVNSPATITGKATLFALANSSTTGGTDPERLRVRLYRESNPALRLDLSKFFVNESLDS